MLGVCMLPGNVMNVGHKTWLELGIHHGASPDDRARKGIVRVSYRNGTWEDFHGIDTREYFVWSSGGFRPSHAPSGIAFRAFCQGHPQDVDLDDGQEWVLTAVGWLTQDRI